MTEEDILELLRSRLSIRVRDGNFTDPNLRIVSLLLDDVEIASDYFNVVQEREFYG